ncbi:immunoglobulin superfamily member 5 isoform X2 [Elgaria multicarinata webbii]|uniref:immunoglobulin superfamily member 5 isoform X2 n=1 Tax=Elgaria multicarinata webbii TaxID=159646 RepID=UPI002FCCFD5E
MDRFHKRIGLSLSLLALLAGPGFSNYIIEGPQNVTILAGSDARFNCTVSEGWEIIIWLFDGNPKLSVLNNGRIIRPDNRYNQHGYKNGAVFTSELIIYDVQLNDSGQIKCSIQNEDDNNYAFLSVQVNGSLNIKDRNFTVRKNQTIQIVCEALQWVPAPHIFWMENNISLDNSMYITNKHQGLNGLYNEESTLTLTPMMNVTVTCLAAINALSKPQYATVSLTMNEPLTKSGTNEDWRTRTIILAVVLSVVGLILLIVIILLIICCCKRRKESNYQKELRKVSEKKPPDRNLETMSHSGKDNYGYSPEEQKHAEEMTRDPTCFPANSNIYSPKQDLKVSPPSEISSQFSSSSQSLQRISPVLSLDHVNQCSQKGTTQQSRRVLFRIASSRIHKSRARQQLYSSKRHPHIQQSDGKHHYTSKLYPQRQQSIGQRAYTGRLAHQPEQPKAQDPQRPVHQNRKQHMYSRMQQKKSHHQQIRAQSQEEKVQTFQRKLIYSRPKTRALRAQPPS